MIAVTISINGKPLVMRSAVRIKGTDDSKECEYRCDEGSIIKHVPNDGASRLVKKMLDTINHGWENGR